MPDTIPLSTDAPSEEITDAVVRVSQQLKAIETFIARRFDELSMEINATAQQMDMAEDDMGSRFAEIIQIMKAVSFSGDGDTPANTGVELDAVVKASEAAANTIMDAADRMLVNINDHVTKTSDKTVVDALNKDIEEIYTACSFQDITGQRVRKTLENLKNIEDRLDSALDSIGVDIETPEKAAVTLSKSATQADIDALFND